MLAAHVAEGVISALEAEQLTGFLLLEGAGVELPERTARRRRERLRELGVRTSYADELLARELGHAVARGDISAALATAAAGRFMLGCARLGIDVAEADELAAGVLTAVLGAQRP